MEGQMLSLKSKAYRDRQKAEMIYETRKDSQGRALCHLCNLNVGTDMHEIINRAQTHSNQTALRYTFDKRLCSWLCRECHTKAMTYENESALWTRNIRHYGRQEVLYAIEQVEEA